MQVPWFYRGVNGGKMTKAQDSIDRDLIALLSTNARMSTSEIARRLQLARSTVNERILRLEKSGVIVGYCAVVAAEKDEMQTRAFLTLDVQPTKTRSVLHALRGYPEVQECWSVSGPHALMCHVSAPCTEDIDALVEELFRLDGVQNAVVTVVLGTKFDKNMQHGARGGQHLTLAS